MSLDDVRVVCVVCGSDVPIERKRRRSITCQDACAKERNRYLRKRADAKKCRFCGQPCTDEEKVSYRAWRKSLREQTKVVVQ
jgi:hypothetical protein